MALCFFIPAVMAQSFPDKPLRIVVSAPPGGTTDMMARVVADGVSKTLGQAVIVDNKPGGGGMVALLEMQKAPKDGHTLLLAPNGMVTEVPHAFKLPADPMKAMTPLAELARAGLFFVGNVGLPASNLREAIAHVKANPGKISYASYTAGTISHTLGLTLNERTGIDMTHVPYRGSVAGLADVMGGHVNYMFDAPGTVLPLYKAGKIKVFATTGSERNPAAPDVPTFAELGFKDMTENPWIGMFCAPEVPAAIQIRLNETLTRLMVQPSVRERWADIGMAVPPLPAPTPQALVKTLQAESAAHAKRLAAIGFQQQ